jgi:hypothetical protein
MFREGGGGGFYTEGKKEMAIRTWFLGRARGVEHGTHVCLSLASSWNVLSPGEDAWTNNRPPATASIQQQQPVLGCPAFR